MLELGDAAPRRRDARLRDAPAIGDEVDRLGRAAHEHDLARVGGVEEAPHRLARASRSARSSARSGDRRRDARWHSRCGRTPRPSSITGGGLLRARRAVEEDQAGIAREDREVALDAARVEACRARGDCGGMRLAIGHGYSPFPSQRARCAARCARRAWIARCAPAPRRRRLRSASGAPRPRRCRASADRTAPPRRDRRPWRRGCI